jgi:hypothetical protein
MRLPDLRRFLIPFPIFYSREIDWSRQPNLRCGLGEPPFRSGGREFESSRSPTKDTCQQGVGLIVDTLFSLVVGKRPRLDPGFIRWLLERVCGLHRTTIRDCVPKFCRPLGRDAAFRSLSWLRADLCGVGNRVQKPKAPRRRDKYGVPRIHSVPRIHTLTGSIRLLTTRS